MRPEPRLTAYERALLSQWHAAFLSQVVFPGVVTFTFQANYVDPRLTAAKVWRDVYHYDAVGHSTGWTRLDGQQQVEFNAAGQRVEERDAAGRCVKARTVIYERAAPSKAGADQGLSPNLSALTMRLGDEFVYYTYDGEGHTAAREVRREPASTAPTP